MKSWLKIISNQLIDVIRLLNLLIDKISKSSERPLAWLSEENRPKAEALRAENPERYDYVMKILKLYFS